MALAIRNVREHKKLIDALCDRERLISIAAHELRGPLCAVRLCLQSLQRSRVALAPKASRMLEIMIKEERRVARLIDDLFDLGRIRSGQLELDLSTFDLCDLAREVGAQMKVQMSGDGIELRFDLQGPWWDAGTGRGSIRSLATSWRTHASTARVGP